MQQTYTHIHCVSICVCIFLTWIWLTILNKMHDISNNNARSGGFPSSSTQLDPQNCSVYSMALGKIAPCKTLLHYQLISTNHLTHILRFHFQHGVLLACREPPKIDKHCISYHTSYLGILVTRWPQPYSSVFAESGVENNLSNPLLLSPSNSGRIYFGILQHCILGALHLKPSLPTT